MKHRKQVDDIKTGVFTLLREEHGGIPYLLAVRCPVYRRRDSDSGFRTELENLIGDAKGKGTSGDPVRLKVPMRRPGADCPVVVWKRV